MQGHVTGGGFVPEHASGHPAVSPGKALRSPGRGRSLSVSLCIFPTGHAVFALEGVGFTTMTSPPSRSRAPRGWSFPTLAQPSSSLRPHPGSAPLCPPPPTRVLCPVPRKAAAVTGHQGAGPVYSHSKSLLTQKWYQTWTPPQQHQPRRGLWRREASQEAGSVETRSRCSETPAKLEGTPAPRAHVAPVAGFQGRFPAAART